MTSGFNVTPPIEGDWAVIDNVDLYGFLGRENHPELSDIGTVVEILEVLEESDDYVVYSCLTLFEDSPRALELTDSEIIYVF